VPDIVAISVHEVLVGIGLPSGPLEEPEPDEDPPLEPDEVDDPDASAGMPPDDEPPPDDDPPDVDPLPPELELPPESFVSIELPLPPIGPHAVLVKRTAVERTSARLRFATG
jgi:hypothetical protein